MKKKQKEEAGRMVCASASTFQKGFTQCCKMARIEFFPTQKPLTHLHAWFPLYFIL